LVGHEPAIGCKRFTACVKPLRDFTRLAFGTAACVSLDPPADNTGSALSTPGGAFRGNDG
jgi:hypothetical protein